MGRALAHRRSRAGSPRVQPGGLTGRERERGRSRFTTSGTWGSERVRSRRLSRRSSPCAGLQSRGCPICAASWRSWTFEGDELDELLEVALDNWRMERLALLDRGILRIAAAELICFGEIPPKVSIQEAVRLAERYSSPESPGFVNGVLDALYKRVIA